jgi:hypothetical protein
VKYRSLERTPFSKTFLKSAALDNLARFSKRALCIAKTASLQCEAMPAFSTTRLQYLAATERTTARPKTMRPGTFDTAWLKCSFHCLGTCICVYSEPRILLMRVARVKAEAAVFSVICINK